jgi:tryptophanyl-tRNA synthetase
LNNYLIPFREKRAEFAKDEQKIWDILEDGRIRAQKIAQNTMEEVRYAIGLP